MRLTKKLLGLLHRVFDKNPYKVLLFRLQYEAGMTWTVSDAVLSTVVQGGQGANLSIDLTQYTVGDLINYLSSQPGYSLAFANTSEIVNLSATILMDDANDIALSNGDHFYGYTNPLWSYMEANANELRQARASIQAMPAQMSTTSATGDWLVLLGKQYGVPKLTGEPDSSYGPRIIAEVLRPKNNNVALEMAISYYTGQDTTVTDVVEYGPTFPLYNSVITRDGSHTYSASAAPIYGLFDVQYAYDLINGADPTTFQQTVAGIVQRLRAAGTHMRSLSLQASAMNDAATPPTEGGFGVVARPALADTLTAPADSFGSLVTISQFSDALSAPTDSESITIAYNYRYASVRHYNGAIKRMGVQSVTESI
ncbi:hypothetical protein [Paraburkholderia phenoliruptrix]|uniref:hypothetical protein n=1 Tax=Paraburkholderia phenoliruptrix TaxID=252970 RepID=UPI0034D001C7